MNDLSKISQSSTDDLARVRSLGENILVLLNKDISLAEVLETTGEFLAAHDNGGVEEANVYLLNWARAAAVGTQTKIGI